MQVHNPFAPAHARASDTTVSRLNPLRVAPRPPAGLLSVVFPRVLAAAFPIDGSTLVLGRTAEGQLRHPTVSRSHVQIAWSAAAGGYVARDLESRNGSALDGARLGDAPRPIADGSVLRVGDVLAVWECSAALGEPDHRALGDALADAVPGRSAVMRALRAAIARAAGDRAPVLILGETGSGKERVARELHRLSGRPGALVAINCAALQPSLVESELFGHSRGAFTGAHEAQRGFFREAHGGTLFLDEIGELPVALQAKLLRAIQEQEVQPVGGADPIAIDVRVVAATHRKPADAIAAGLLREDLYARLSLWELHVPPLRARRIDLLDWLVRLHTAWRGAGVLPPLSVDTVEQLLLQRWPLNLRAVERLVRELANRPGDLVVEPGDLPPWLDAPDAAIDGGFEGRSGEASGEASDDASPGARPASSSPSSRDDTASGSRSARPPLPSRDEFVAAFCELGGSVRALARRFGRERRQIYRWIEAHGVRGAR